MKNVILTALASALLFSCASKDQGQVSLDATAGPEPVERASHLNATAVATVKAYLDRRLGKREMEQTNLGVRTDYPDWKGFPLTHWRYEQPGGKVAEVLMLNADNDQIARWVAHTCLELRGQLLASDYERLCNQIKSQSGGQFPVAGIVYEDMNGPHVIYGFRDGVTVGFEGIQNGEDRKLKPAEIQASLDRDTGIRYVGKFARIQSTTAAQYAAWAGVPMPTNAAFLKASRESYQRAWRNDRNEMMLAWAKANFAGLKR